ILAMSTSVIWIKAGTTHPFVVAALRLLIACVLLTPIFLRDRARHRELFTAEHLRRTLLPAAVLAAHFLSWTAGARMTGSAQASLIVNMVPVAVPFLLFYVTGERINRLEIAGTALAISGVLVLTLRDAIAGSGLTGVGNLVCFASMLMFALYITLGRRNRDFPTVWLYVVPVYFTAGIICLVVSLPWIGSFDAGSGREWIMIAGLAVVPTILGHSLLNNAVRHLRGQLVSLCTVGQFVFAGAMGWIFFRESPAPLFYAASALVVAGIVIVVLNTPASPAVLQPDQSQAP
ncbi:MAG TPA: DMT family transporter, partial [Opitutaceae bacterium]|nr:DMT family transporter [Opitutaceae bacterium]